MTEQQRGSEGAGGAALTLERFAEVQAHIRHFGVQTTHELLVRFEIDSLRWVSDSAAWSSALVAEAEADAGCPLAVAFGVPYRETLDRLKRENPPLSSIGKAPPVPASESPAARVEEKPRLEEAPAREADKPTYLLADAAAPAIATPSVTVAAPVIAAPIQNRAIGPMATAVVVTSAQAVRIAEAPSNILESGTLPAGDEPAAPSTPFTTSTPDESGFSLPQYAKLCAQLVRSGDRAAVLLAAKLDPARHAALDAHWRGRMQNDRKLSAAFQRSYADQMVELGREEALKKSKPGEASASGSVLSSGTLQLETPPSSPPKAVATETPLAQAVPRLTLAEHADLCAEVALGVETVAALLARRGISAAEKDSDDAHYRRLVNTDRSTNQAWQAAFEHSRRQILARGRVR